MDTERFDNYYQSCFAETNVKTAEQTFDTYDRCFRTLLPSSREGKVLDFGAGLGNLTAWLKTNGFINIVSIDVSRDQCEAAAKLGIDVRHVQDPLKFLNASENAFDVIFMSDVIEHIPKAEMIKYLKLLRACLREGGSIIIKTENVATPTGIYQHHMDFTHEYNFVDKSLKQVLLISGFNNVTVQGHSVKWPRRPWLWWRPILRFFYIECIKIIYSAEQPRGSNNPKIYSNSLIAKADK